VLPLSQDHVFGHTVAVRVLNSNEVKAPFLGIKRFNGHDDATSVPDSSQHAGTRMVD
jgi:hypothetical protein